MFNWAGKSKGAPPAEREALIRRVAEVEPMQRFEAANGRGADEYTKVVCANLIATTKTFLETVLVEFPIDVYVTRCTTDNAQMLRDITAYVAMCLTSDIYSAMIFQFTVGDANGPYASKEEYAAFEDTTGRLLFEIVNALYPRSTEANVALNLAGEVRESLSSDFLPEAKMNENEVFSFAAGLETLFRIEAADAESAEIRAINVGYKYSVCRNELFKGTETLSHDDIIDATGIPLEQTYFWKPTRPEAQT